MFAVIVQTTYRCPVSPRNCDGTYSPTVLLSMSGVGQIGYHWLSPEISIAHFCVAA
jgi:hypothetical protein